jgi:hypothetical protein
MGMWETVKNAVSQGEQIQLQNGEVYHSKEFQKYGMEVLRTPNHDQRVMFYKKGCNICPKWIKAIRRFNMRVLPKDRIDIIEIGGLDPRNQLLEPEAAPEVYLDGIVIQGATSVDGQVGFLEGFFEDAIIVHSTRQEIERVQR